MYASPELYSKKCFIKFWVKLVDIAGCKMRICKIGLINLMVKIVGGRVEGGDVLSQIVQLMTGSSCSCLSHVFQHNILVAKLPYRKIGGSTV